MVTLLWILQILLAVIFFGAGATKLIQPRDKLAANMGDWVNVGPTALPKLLGLAEVLAAIGLVVPPLVHIAPIRTPVAAAALVVVMVGAVVVHARRREYGHIAANLALAIMAGVVAWGRFGPYAF
ncbi:DoxX family protein [Mycobacterium sp. NPDC051198]